MGDFQHQFSPQEQSVPARFFCFSFDMKIVINNLTVQFIYSSLSHLLS